MMESNDLILNYSSQEATPWLELSTSASKSTETDLTTLAETLKPVLPRLKLLCNDGSTIHVRLSRLAEHSNGLEDDSSQPTKSTSGRLRRTKEKLESSHDSSLSTDDSTSS